jgi:hypothetical protein
LTHELKLESLKFAMNFGSLTLGVDKLLSKAQTTESLSNLKDLVRLSKFTVAMLKGGFQGGMILQKGAFDESQRLLGFPLVWDPQNESSDS